MSNVTVAFEVGATLGEGALWDWRSDRLLSVDIPAVCDVVELFAGEQRIAAELHGEVRGA